MPPYPPQSRSNPRRPQWPAPARESWPQSAPNPGRAARPACTATSASAVKRHLRPHFGHHLGPFLANRGRHRILRHAVEERFNAVRPRPRDGLHAFGQVCLGIRLRLGTHKHHAAHPLRRPPPQLQQHVAANGAAAKNCLGNFQMIEQRENVRGKLRHGQHWRAGNASKCSSRQSRSQFGEPVSAQIGNDGANARKLSRKRTPILAIERRGMQQNNRQPLARVAVT